MTDKIVRTIPWSTKIESHSDFTDNGWGWTVGTNVILDRHEDIGAQSSSDFTTNGITWYRQGVGQSSGSCQSMFESGGFESYLDNGKDYNAVHFFGTYVSTDNFRNDTFTYPTDASSAFVKNAIGFGCITDIGRSFSDSGGGAQAKLQKVCFFYMHPTSRVRHTYQLDQKIGGNTSLGSDFSNSNQYWFSYRLSDTNISTVRTQGLQLMGMGLQFFHGHKSVAGSRVSANKIRQMRVLVAEYSSYLRTAKTHQLLYCIPDIHKVSERSNPHSFTL